MRWARKAVGSAPACPLPCRTLTVLVSPPWAEAAPPSLRPLHLPTPRPSPLPTLSSPAPRCGPCACGTPCPCCFCCASLVVCVAHVLPPALAGAACGWNAVGAQRGWKCAGVPPPLSHAYLVGAFAAGRSSAAIAVLRPAPWAEATQPSPSSTLPFGPKQRRQRRPPLRCHGRQGTQWRAAVDAPPGNQPRRQKLALSIKVTLWHPVVLQVSPRGTAHRTAATLTPRNAANRSIAWRR